MFNFGAWSKMQVRRNSFRPGPARGQSAAEVALLLPALVLAIFGTIETGRLFFGWVTVVHAARTAARFAVTGQGEQTGDRVQRTQDAGYNATAGLKRSDVTVEVRSWRGNTASGSGIQGDGGRPCDMIEVEVDYSYRPVVPVIKQIIPNTVVLRGRDRKINEPWAKCP